MTMNYRCRQDGCLFSGRIQGYIKHIFSEHTDPDQPVEERRDRMRDIMRENAGIARAENRTREPAWCTTSNREPAGSMRWTPGDPVL